MGHVLITGASGFVGGHVARRLAETRAVTCLVRTPGGKTVVDLDHPNITLVQGDLTDAASLQRAAAGAELVVHAATDTRLKDRARSWDVAVDGTGRLHAAAAQAGARRFVFISSAAVYAGNPDAGEEEPLQPCGDLYGDAKIAAERLLLGASGPEVVILRPPAVYGPGSQLWTAAMWKQVRAGKAYLPGGGAFPFAYVYIDNLVDAVVAALQAPAPHGVYNVFDGATTYAGYLQPLLEAAGQKPKRIPWAVLHAAAAVAELFAALTGKYVPISRKTIAALTGRRSRALTCDKARRDLAWEPRIDFAEGSRRSLDWLRGQPVTGLLAKPPQLP